MGSTTPVLKLPYPVGTDRVMDGDNAMQALAERIEARLPYGHLGSAVKVGNSAGISTTLTDVAGLSVNVTVPAGRRIRVTAYVLWQMVTANGQINLRLAEDTTWIQSHLQDANANQFVGSTFSTIREPAAGAHTYKVAAATTPGSTVTVHSTAPVASQIVVEDIGPVVVTE